MKKILTAILALAGTGLLTSAYAQNVAGPVSNDGDIFIGVREVGAANDLLTDIGNVSAFVGLTPGTVLSLNNNTSSGDNGSTNAIGGIGADIGTTFSTTYATAYANSSILWAAIGGVQFAGDGADNDTGNTLYSSRQVVSPTWNRGTSGGQATGISDYNGISNFYSAPTHSTTANSNWNQIQTASSTNSYAYFQPGGAGVAGQGNISFGVFSPTNESAGLSSVLYLDEIIPGTGASTELGYFALDSLGDLTFTAQAVPEPSTYAAGALGLIALIVTGYRRYGKSSVKLVA